MCDFLFFLMYNILGMHELLVEMLIVGIIGLVSIGFGTWFLITHWHEKDWEKLRAFFLGGIIFMAVMVSIFEIVWFCMYTGLPV